jgi:hypothetical protein
MAFGMRSDAMTDFVAAIDQGHPGGREDEEKPGLDPEQPAHGARPRARCEASDGRDASDEDRDHRQSRHGIHRIAGCEIGADQDHVARHVRKEEPGEADEPDGVDESGDRRQQPELSPLW